MAFTARPETGRWRQEGRYLRKGGGRGHAPRRLDATLQGSHASSRPRAWESSRLLRQFLILEFLRLLRQVLLVEFSRLLRQYFLVEFLRLLRRVLFLEFLRLLRQVFLDWPLS
jgi:hypothetical protein